MKNGILYRAWGGMVQFFNRLGWMKGTLFVAVILILLVGGLAYLRSQNQTEAAPDNTTPSVTLATVSDLAQGGSSLSVGGTVESETEATVLAQKSAAVTVLYHALGDNVSAGTIVAELENSSERAAVLQAQGSVDAATAGANTSVTTLSSAQANAVATILSAYSAVDTAVRSDVDPLFSQVNTSQPQLIIQTSDSQSKTDAQNERVTLTAIWQREQAQSATLSSQSDLASEFTVAESELRQVRDFLDTLIRALNAGVAANGISDAEISADKATVTTARTNITTALSALIAAEQQLNNAAQNSTSNNIGPSSSQAAITQAQGTLAAAKAALEKTIIRAPISGTINSLPIKQGDFVQAMSPILTVANNNALEVVAYVTADDASRIAVGDKATLDTGIVGTITRIAPALDPVTKKIEVRIGLPADASLLNGQSVVVTFTKPAYTTPKPTNGPITIPLSALKIGATEIDVFTVTASSTLAAHPVTLGLLMGDRVAITSGLTPDMIIVTDARGLQSAETVIVKQ